MAMKKPYCIMFHSRIGKVPGRKTIEAFSVKQARFLFNQFDNQGNELIIDDIKVGICG